MRVLSFSQPWLWSILHANKRVENRPWQPSIAMVGQRIALHAAKSWDDGAIRYFTQIGLADRYEIPMRFDLYPKSQIVGVATIDRIITKPDKLDDEQRRWFFGPYGWILDDVEALKEPIDHKGAQGLRELPDFVTAAIERQVGVFEPREAPPL